MSLCNTCRLFVSLIIVLSIIDTLAAYTLGRATRGASSRDIAEYSDLIEVRKGIKRSITTESDLLTNASEKQDIKNEADKSNNYVESQVSSSDSINVAQENNQSETTEDSLTTSSIKYTTRGDNEELSVTIGNSNVATDSRKVEFDEHETTTNNDEPETTTVFESTTFPTWKKYTTIERKRQPTTTTDDDIASYKTEEMVKAETKQLRPSLKDTVTSDIPSLEQLKNELLYSTLKDRVLGTDDEKTSTAVVEFFTTTEVIPTSTKLDTFVSKRAGFLDLSEKETKPTLSAEQTSDVNINSKENTRAMFEIESSDTYFPAEKIENKAESQGRLNEDSIKEELLKEKLLKESEDIIQRFDSKSPPQPETQILNSTTINSPLELSVKPLNSDKIKNVSLYTVNPNYKPLKKIEVQAPKQFVRDPDDNSWRNESLSSLGIVFKPKNSSKPFTQVLKNKTETEWNNLLEKDSKNDIPDTPDLKERLQKMGEKRKSKRKKTDALGNVVYFDYEESSGSGEHVTTDQPLLSVTSSTEPPKTTESPTATENVNSTSSEGPLNATYVTSTTTSTPDKVRGNVRNPYSTNKFKKFFNLPEYYDTTDEDDTDYLNLAKIDIKKFTTSTTTAPTTTASSPLVTLRSWPFNKSSFTISPHRKGTIQYFPPLTTQKVNINDYDNDFKAKANSYTTNIEPPKNALAVSFDNPTTPVNSIQYIPRDDQRIKPYVITSHTEFDKTFYSTRPPQTTHSAFTLLNDDVTFDRDSYVIRQYKDFINEAAKDNEFDKSVDYVPYTQAPSRDTPSADLITYVTEKPKLNMDNEYDYDTQFRKDVLQRFVDNFNQNSERFKSDFPILFNNSVIHRDTESGREIASSRAFMRGLYNTDAKTKHASREGYDPNNENMTVELSPAYELHYYMPEQEEKEQAAPQPVTPPDAYTL